MSIVASAKGGKKFDPHPEFHGIAVCVDVTPLEKVQTDYGEKEKFRFVFETTYVDKEGKNGCVWSAGMTPTLGDRASLRKFLRGWLGRDLTEQELESFEVEKWALGRCAHILVVHEPGKEPGQVFANIQVIKPCPAGQEIKPSGKFVRKQDRDKNKGSTYRNAGKAGETADQDGGNVEGGEEHLKIKVHVGKHKGLEFRELAPEAIEGLSTHWLPTAKANAKPTADDKRLMAALDWYAERQAAAATANADDDVPY